MTLPAQYERHPLSAVWPDLDTNLQDGLRESMRTRGYDRLEPVVLHEGKVLDGWHRYSIARELGIEVKTADYEGDDPAGFVIGRHVGRRHLTPRERADCVVRCREWAPTGRPVHDREHTAPDDRGAGGGERRSDGRLSGKPSTNRDLAQEADVSERTIRRAKAQVRPKDENNDGPAAGGAKPPPLPAGVQRSQNERRAELRRVERNASDRAEAREIAEAHVKASGRRVEPDDLHHVPVDGLSTRIEAGSVDAVATVCRAAATTVAVRDFAVHALRPGGVLLALVWPEGLCDLVRSITVDTLIYRWTDTVLVASPRDVPAARVHGSRRVCCVVCTRVGADPEFVTEAETPGSPPALLATWVKPGGVVCDPCCGVGRVLAAAREAGFRCIGADVDEERLAHVRRVLGVDVGDAPSGLSPPAFASGVAPMVFEPSSDEAATAAAAVRAAPRSFAARPRLDGWPKEDPAGVVKRRRATLQAAAVRTLQSRPHLLGQLDEDEVRPALVLAAPFLP